MRPIIRSSGGKILPAGIADCATNQLGPVRPTPARRGVRNSCRRGTFEMKPTRLCSRPGLGRRPLSAKIFW
jgi:hypothetical protein